MHYQRFLLSATLAAVLTACGGGDTKTPQVAAPVAPNNVTFTAMDFTFEGPAEIPAGPTTISLVSKGVQLHHLILVKLDSGKTKDSLVAAFSKPGPPPAWATFVGGPNASAPGGTANATLDLEPGNYAVLCFIDMPEHKPHFTRGMSAALTVTAASGTVNAALPAPTSTITLSEYAFTLDKDLVAGKNTIRLVNTGVEPHEIEIIRLAPGKTMEDFGKWMATMQGEPPAVPLGGVSPFARGKDTQFDVDLVAGNYVMLCFVHDTSTPPKLHFERGMIKEFSIK